MENIMWVILNLYWDEVAQFVGVVCGTKEQAIAYIEQVYRKDNPHQKFDHFVAGKINEKGATELHSVFPGGQVNRVPDFVIFPLDIVELG